MKNLLIHTCRAVSCLVLLVGSGLAMAYFATGGTNSSFLNSFFPANGVIEFVVIFAMIALPILIILNLHPQKNPSRDYLFVRIFPKLAQQPDLGRFMTDLTLILIPVIIAFLPWILLNLAALMFSIFLGGGGTGDW